MAISNSLLTKYSSDVLALSHILCDGFSLCVCIAKRLCLNATKQLGWFSKLLFIEHWVVVCWWKRHKDGKSLVVQRASCLLSTIIIAHKILEKSVSFISFQSIYINHIISATFSTKTLIIRISSRSSSLSPSVLPLLSRWHYSFTWLGTSLAEGNMKIAISIRNKIMENIER